MQHIYYTHGVVNVDGEREHNALKRTRDVSKRLMTTRIEQQDEKKKQNVLQNIHETRANTPVSRLVRQNVTGVMNCELAARHYVYMERAALEYIGWSNNTETRLGIIKKFKFDAWINLIFVIIPKITIQNSNCYERRF